MIYSIYGYCRVCGSKEFVEVGSFGMQPLTGIFLDSPHSQPPSAPLELQTCKSCRLMQLRHEVNREEMYRTYFYRSSINSTMVSHLSEIARQISTEFLPYNGTIIDTGCNDGTFLRSIDRTDIKKIGIDPSDSVNRIDDLSISIFNEFFPCDSLAEYLGGRKASVITSISMFYDINDPSEFVRSVCNFLEDDGVWIVEMNYTGDMLFNAAFDMVSHEHVTYYTLETFSALISRHGLLVFRVERTSINGGSIRLYCGRTRKPERSVSELSEFESSHRINEISTHQDFYQRCLKFKTALLDLIHEKKSAGVRLATYGASTRGNAIILFCGLTTDEIEFAVDRNSEKVGRYCPGSKIPIVSEDLFRRSAVKSVLVLPYGFLEEFISREAAYLSNGGEFIIPFPRLSVLKLDERRQFSMDMSQT